MKLAKLFLLLIVPGLSLTGCSQKPVKKNRAVIYKQKIFRKQ